LICLFYCKINFFFEKLIKIIQNQHIKYKWTTTIIRDVYSAILMVIMDAKLGAIFKGVIINGIYQTKEQKPQKN
jgi:hypothetical protein